MQYEVNMFIVFFIMMILAVGSLCLIAIYLVLGKHEKSNKKCHTENIKIEDTPGNSEPHV